MSQILKYNQLPDYLNGKLLVAMPYTSDQKFSHLVIYVCGHDASGAMGLIINKQLDSVNFKDLLAQININYTSHTPDKPLYYGGATEVGRGFVLHTADYLANATVKINNNLALTANLEVLHAISDNKGPRNSLVILGYTSWNAAQLENEIQNNNWLIIDADETLIFNKDPSTIWQHAFDSIGVNLNYLILESGHA